jgi:hypothetical protein
MLGAMRRALSVTSLTLSTNFKEEEEMLNLTKELYRTMIENRDNPIKDTNNFGPDWLEVPLTRHQSTWMVDHRIDLDDFFRCTIYNIGEEDFYGVVYGRGNWKANLTGWFFNLDDRSASAWIDGVHESISNAYARRVKAKSADFSEGDYRTITLIAQSVVLTAAKKAMWMPHDDLPIDYFELPDGDPKVDLD